MNHELAKKIKKRTVSVNHFPSIFKNWLKIINWTNLGYSCVKEWKNDCKIFFSWNFKRLTLQIKTNEQQTAEEFALCQKIS